MEVGGGCLVQLTNCTSSVGVLVAAAAAAASVSKPSPSGYTAASSASFSRPSGSASTCLRSVFVSVSRREGVREATRWVVGGSSVATVGCQNGAIFLVVLVCSALYLRETWSSAPTGVTLLLQTTLGPSCSLAQTVPHNWCRMKCGLVEGFGSGGCHVYVLGMIQNGNKQTCQTIDLGVNDLVGGAGGPSPPPPPP